MIVLVNYCLFLFLFESLLGIFGNIICVLIILLMSTDTDTILPIIFVRRKFQWESVFLLVMQIFRSYFYDYICRDLPCWLRWATSRGPAWARRAQGLSSRWPSFSKVNYLFFSLFWFISINGGINWWIDWADLCHNMELK